MEGFDDAIVTIQDLHMQRVSYDTSLTELIFKSKQFKKYLSFRKALLKAGIDYCKKTLSGKELYFLVLEENTFIIWRSGQLSESASFNLPGQAASSEPTPQITSISPPSPTISPEFLEHCCKTMLYYRGPAAIEVKFASIVKPTD